MFEGIKRDIRDLKKEVKSLGNLGRDTHMEGESIQAVREGRALPTPEFAAENPEMQAALMKAIDTLSPEELNSLDASMQRVVAAQGEESEQILHDIEHAGSLSLRTIGSFLLGALVHPAAAPVAAYANYSIEKKGNLREGAAKLEDLEYRVQSVREMIGQSQARRESVANTQGNSEAA